MLPNAKMIGEGAFNSSNICSLVCPNMQVVKIDAFSDGHGPTVIDMPNLTLLGTYAFNGNTGVESIRIPKLSTLYDATF